MDLLGSAQAVFGAVFESLTRLPLWSHRPLPPGWGPKGEGGRVCPVGPDTALGMEQCSNGIRAIHITYMRACRLCDSWGAEAS